MDVYNNYAIKDIVKSYNRLSMFNFLSYVAIWTQSRWRRRAIYAFLCNFHSRNDEGEYVSDVNKKSCLEIN